MPYKNNMMNVICKEEYEKKRSVLGTGYLGSHLFLGYDGKPDFVVEAKMVKNEKIRIGIK